MTLKAIIHSIFLLLQISINRNNHRFILLNTITMKKQVLLFSSLIIFLLTGIQQISAQDAAINSRLKTYIDATNAEEWDKVLDMVYDKLFETVPKD